MTSALSGQGLLSEDLEMLPRIFDGIEGWLWPDAGWLTAYLMNATRESFSDENNAVVEFGTYKGKYLSLLYYLTRLEKARVLGVDIFTLTTPDEVSAGIADLLQDATRLSLLKADTKTLDASDIRSALNASSAKFISIDAEHKAAPVYHDLQLSQEVLAEGGIIAVDDYTNVHCPGVTEGAINFLLSDDNARLAPFTSCCNKLFLTTESHQQRYHALARRFIDDVDFTTSHERFFTRSASQNDQMLCGFPVWVISHTKAGANPDEQRQIQKLTA